jgi:diadenosine tetraphosphate (Ap4A) HIT family hydrolase
MVIYSTSNFNIEVPDAPHIDRLDGGHLIISPKFIIEDRTQLSPAMAIELTKLTMIAGEAMKTALNRQGIDVARINYQENGNWLPYLHVHLYGRAQSAKTQKFGTPLYFPAQESGFYTTFQPLNSDDIREILTEIEILANDEKFKSFP